LQKISGTNVATWRQKLAADFPSLDLNIIISMEQPTLLSSNESL
jgi:hypothetical protein